MSKVMVIIADGFEEIEAVSVIDILRRAQIETDAVSLGGDSVKSSRGLTIVPDKKVQDINSGEYDMIVLPGGMPGAKNINESADVEKILKKFAAEEKFIAAICAAPFVLAEKGILKGCMATSYPSFKEIVEKYSDYQDAAIVVDENIVTSRGPATAAEFAFTLVELLKDEETAEKLREGMLFTCD